MKNHYSFVIINLVLFLFLISNQPPTSQQESNNETDPLSDLFSDDPIDNDKVDRQLSEDSEYIRMKDIKVN